jgi:hypothetical protein
MSSFSFNIYNYEYKIVIITETGSEVHPGALSPEVKRQEREDSHSPHELYLVSLICFHVIVVS